MSTVLDAPPQSCEPCASQVATLRTIATSRGDRFMLRELDAFAARIASRVAARREPPFGAESLAMLRLKVQEAGRWADERAFAHLEQEQDCVAALLDEALEPLSAVPRHERRRRAHRLMRVILHERLASWHAVMRHDMQELYRSLARRVAGVYSPPWSADSRLFYRFALPQAFLDLGAGWDMVVEACAPRERAWRRVRRQLHDEARVLLRANVTRIVDDLKQQLQDSVTRLALRTAQTAAVEARR